MTQNTGLIKICNSQ